MTVRSRTRGSNDGRFEDFLAAGLRDPAPSDRSGMSWTEERGEADHVPEPRRSGVGNNVASGRSRQLLER